jgi:hypothetical protein
VPALASWLSVNASTAHQVLSAIDQLSLRPILPRPNSYVPKESIVSLGLWPPLTAHLGLIEILPGVALKPIALPALSAITVPRVQSFRFYAKLGHIARQNPHTSRPAGEGTTATR